MGLLLRINFLDPYIPDSIGGIQGRKGRIKQTLYEYGLGKWPFKYTRHLEPSTLCSARSYVPRRYYRSHRHGLQVPRR